jgi:hypothetical protein
MDFVVNGAGFDEERILWARSMDTDANRKLIDYFHDRHIWVLDGDEDFPQLKRLPENADTFSPSPSAESAPGPPPIGVTWR